MEATKLKGFNLSIQQMRLWSLQKDSKSYRAQCAVQLEGQLNVAALLHALQSLVNRHAILRTQFYCLPGMEIPLQMVNDSVEVEGALVDLKELSQEAQDEQYRLCFTHLQNKPFDFEHGPLVRTRLLRLSTQNHLFLISLPALSADDATLVQCMSELSQAYSEALGVEQQMREPLQYADVSAWQDAVMEEDAQNLREYWRKIDLLQMGPVRFPWKHAGRMNGTQTVEQQAAFVPQVLTIPLDGHMAKQVLSLTSAADVSVSAWLLTCWQIAIWHLLDVPGMVMGVACNGRIDEELMDALGLYSRFVPLRIRLVDDLPFEQALALTSASLQEAFEAQLYFSWEMESANGLNRNSSRFFSVCFDDAVWPDHFQFAGLTGSLRQRYCCTEQFNLKLSVLQVGEEVQLELSYDSAEVTEEQGKRIASVLLNVLNVSIAQPQILIGNIPLLTANEQEHALRLLRGPAISCPARTLHQLFEEQARLVPGQLAVIDAAEQLSYHELNSRANRLAHFLRRQGVGPNVLVGLCLSRSATMIVGLLAILKAGGAYIPLDPESPSKRLAYQLEASRASLLLTQQTLLSSLPAWDGKTLCLEDLMQEASLEPETNLEISCDPQNLIYVIYTSGSTGLPKGVMIQQQSVVNYTFAICSLLKVQPGWHYATVSTLAADLGNTVIFCALTSGGCLQVLDYATVTSAEAFQRWTELHPIDVLKIVPSHLQALLSGRQAQAVLPRRALLLGGEALTGDLVRRLQSLHGGCVVYNHYGPTETTIGVLTNELGILEEGASYSWEEEEVIPLGRPIANSEAVILNRGQQIVPVGVTGELYLSGAGLAMGYLHQPGQTAERFVPNPFVGTRFISSRPGGRLYRTGDLARYTAAGQIEFMGRRDSQVKIRGYRIELGEIEAVLRSHSSVWQAVVVLRKDIVPEEPQLVGYVTLRNQTSVNAEGLRKFVGEFVPEYMVPATIVVLKELPLTANGKIDRQQLPRPERIQLDEPALTMEPRSPIEEVLLEIWRDLLAIPVIGIHDNFFSLGGHSLLATQIISRIQLLLQVELPILSLFEAPTIAGLAWRVEQALWQGQERTTPALLPRVRPSELPLSFAQQRLWFLDQLEPGSTAYLIPIVQPLMGALDVRILEACLSEVIQRHESLRTTFEEHNGRPVQVIQPLGQVAACSLPVVDLEGLNEQMREDQARCLIAQENRRPFDLMRGPLLRSCLLRLAPEQHILLLTLHHIITDGWSSTILQRELRLLYQAFVTGQPSLLEPLPLQYADYALWQRDWLRDEMLQQQLAYWKQHLAGVMPLELPTDHPRPAMQSGRGASQSLLVSSQMQQELVALSQREGVTLFMTLLAAFQVLLMRYSGQHDISVGIPIANRRQAEVEGLIGFFVNTLVLRSDLSGQPTFVELLGRVRQMALGAYAHQDVPFEMLVEQLELQRDLSRSPLFQVAFSFHRVPEQAETPEGIALGRMEVEETVAKFDLTLTLTSRSQGLTCHLNYNTDLFKASTIARLLEHWQILLQGIVATPQQRISTLPLLSAAERQALLLDVNAPGQEPTAASLHRLIERQAEVVPDCVAIIADEMQLTYSELNHRANQLAHYLQLSGVGPQMVVGVCLDRSISLVIGLLALLKRCAVYLPLDPAYPQERLMLLLQDAHVAALITSQHIQAILPPSDLHFICLDQDWPLITKQSHDNPGSSETLERMAYVIYTSGSTGIPKGVAVTERSLLNLCRWYTSYSQINQETVMLLALRSTFDASIKNILVPLICGGQLVLAPDDYYDAGEMLAVIERRAVTVLNVTPGMFSTLLDEAAPQQFANLASLRYVHLGGEALTRSLLTPWLKSGVCAATITNIYGPTECTDISACYTLNPAQIAEGEIVPIGRPIDNGQLYVLSEEMQLAPIGVPGELYIGGKGLAQGYLNHAELTAASFVPHPFGAQPGARLYKTGDLVRYRMDGALEFLGRMDQQVKIRGFRIELGEIEAVLREHPLVAEAVVQPWQEGQNAYKQLIAYVVGPSVEEAEKQSVGQRLKQYLRERLPEYMIPAFIQWLDVLPLTAHGKIDRRALPRPEVSAEEVDGAWLEVRSPIEELLSEVWSQVLARQPQSKHENFFEAGGHSLLATQLIAHVRKLLEVEVPLRALFEAPTVAGLARQVEQYVQSEQGINLPSLVALPRTREVPLSFAQQRIWFLDQLEPGNPAYLNANAGQLHGDLQVAALELSLQEIVRRHEVLRTTFEKRRGHPAQIIHPAGQADSFTLSLVDLEELDEQERQAEACLLASQESQCPFDLTRGPLLRCWVLRLAPEEHVLLLTLHHIVTDGWSGAILQRELRQLYQAFVNGQPSPLTPLPIQYADYALWQRDWLQGEVLQQQLTYWKEQLTGLTPLELPTDHPRTLFQIARGASLELLLPLSLQQSLIVLSQQEGVTLFMTLLAAFQVLLMRYSGQCDISVGTPIANRRYAEIEGLVGFFVNTLVLRGDLSGQPTFVELLKRVRQVALGAYAHQDMPFEMLVEQLEPQRDLSRSPLFQVMFGVAHQGQAAKDEPGVLALSQFKSEHSTTKFDMTFAAITSPNGLLCSVEYNADIFEASTIQSMLEQWQVLLQGIVCQPYQRIDLLPLLPEPQERMLLQEWNSSSLPESTPRCLHTLLEEQVARTPDTIAVVSEETCLSYAALDAYANQLAHYLRASGVDVETLVGVSVERSAALLICLLGVLKAGGGYVPLDPAYPPARLDLMLADAQVSALLMLHEQSLDAHGAAIICLERSWASIVRQSREAPQNNVQVGNTAYVIYTSGSTGVPKGVMVTHSGLSNLVQVQSDAFGVGTGDHILQFAALSFDASIWETVMALLTGATLDLVPQHRLLPGPDLITVLQERAITVLTAPPSALAVLPQESLPDLATLIVAGEACSRELVSRWAQGRHFWNAYGPTETTICASMALCDDQGMHKPPIGRPIASTQLYVLDEQWQLVPPGVAGELYIGGESLARGYLRQPQMTAERFIPHPFVGGSHDQSGSYSAFEVGARLYRTGDRVRLRADGQLEYLGRVDNQVKLRGYRIELEEIEAVLRKELGVLEVVVLLREDTPGEQRLVAYFVSEPASAIPSSEQIRSYLQEQMPAYMVPAVFVPMEELPLSPSGKVDRRALPLPEDLAVASDELDITLARNPIEELITEIWKEVLGDDQIDVYENFFDLGGHSLLVTRMLARVQAVLGVEIPVQAMFEESTIASLAQRVESALRTGIQATMPPLLPRDHVQEPLPSFAQQRLWLLDQLVPESTAYLVCSAVKVQGTLHSQALEQSLQEAIRRHEILRTVFEERDGQPVQVIRPMTQAELFRLPVIDLQALSQSEQVQQAERLAQQEEQRPFDLARGPLLRSWLLRVASQEHLLLLTLHHIITDGWSNIILQREVAQLYQAFASGASSPLESLPIQYADYALWQRGWLQGEVLQQQLAYWKKQLAGVTPLELPTDHPRPAVQNGRGASQSVLLPATLQQELLALSRQEGVTLFMTLLAAFQVLLMRYSGQHDISVGTPIANRRHAELEGLIGFFVNTLVLRSDLSGQPTFIELLGRVRQVALEGYAHQDVPFEMLVEQVEPQRDLSRSPLFQVMFSLQQASEAIETPEGVRLSRVEVESTTAKFDLTLTVTSKPQGLACHLNYSTDLFEASTITRLLEHLHVLLQSIVQQPQQRISRLSLLKADQQQQLVQQAKATACCWPQPQLLHQLVEAQVERTPDAIALLYQEESLTYRQLNARANALARRLRARGVGPESVVAVVLERSLWLPVSLLAVLKAGGAYLPVAPQAPQQRLRFMLNEAAVSVVLTVQQHVEQLSALLQAPGGEGEQPLHMQVVAVDQQEILEEASACNLDTAVAQKQLAYVLYTSGSTGQPKGVMISHEAICNHMHWFVRAFPLTPADRVLQKTDAGFDASVWEFYAPWLTGAQLVLAEPEGQRDSRYLLGALKLYAITVLQLVPAQLQMLVEEPGFEQLELMRWLFCGGEPLTAELAQTVQGKLAVPIHNLYGPSETCVDATWWRCEVGAAMGTTGGMPIGEPIANIECYVLDEQGELVPPGVPGELYLAGAGLARGYLKRVEQTAQSFVPHPWGLRGQRLYRTGDRVKLRADGVLEYLGRLDGQVKLRGYRIEIGEIEVQLEQYPGVRQSVVALREEAGGEAMLVGYVVGERNEEELNEERLRNYLRERVPGYMVPQRLVQLEQMPLTANGKVDRAALPMPRRGSLPAESEGLETYSSLEQTLREIWSQVLSSPPRSKHENFFEAGGHSLLAARVIAHVRRLLGVELPLRSLFETSTIAGLAAAIEREQMALVEQTESEELAEMLRMVEELSEEEARLMFDAEL